VGHMQSHSNVLNFSSVKLQRNYQKF